MGFPRSVEMCIFQGSNNFFTRKMVFGVVVSAEYLEIRILRVKIFVIPNYILYVTEK
jgi:hypothetical protein